MLDGVKVKKVRQFEDTPFLGIPEIIVMKEARKEML